MNVEHTRGWIWKGFSFHLIFDASPLLLQVKLQLIGSSWLMNRLTNRNHPIANSGKGVMGRQAPYLNPGILNLPEYHWRSRILGT